MRKLILLLLFFFILGFCNLKNSAAQSPEIDCPASVASYKITHPSLNCNCANGVHAMPVCSGYGSYSASSSYGGGTSSSAMIGAQMATSILGGALGQLFNFSLNPEESEPQGPSLYEIQRQQAIAAERARQEELFRRNKEELLKLLKGGSRWRKYSEGKRKISDLKLKSIPSEEKIKEFLDREWSGQEDGVYIGSGIIPVTVIEGGVTEAEWQMARKWQVHIDHLQEEPFLSPEELKELENLLASRNALWEKVIVIPNLTIEDRQRLKLKFYTDLTAGIDADANIIALSREDALEIQKEHPVQNILSSVLEPGVTSYLTSAAEGVGRVYAQIDSLDFEDISKSAREDFSSLGDVDAYTERLETAGVDFDNWLGVAKVSNELAQGNKIEAAIEGVNWALAYVPLPATTLAISQAGTSIYAAGSREILTRFITKANEAVGIYDGEEKARQFMDDLYDSFSSTQKFYGRFIGFFNE